MSANAAPVPVQPNVHFFEFNEEINPNNNPDRFHVLWHLDAADININQPPQSNSINSKPPDGEWKGIFEGDLVVFPSLLSGAGEFEGVRFVGPKTMHLSPEGIEDEVLPLLTAGIEYPEFPTLIVNMAEERGGVSLRKLYEKPFDAILSSQPGSMTLFDIMGRDVEGYKEFWNDPPVARRRRPPGGDPWKFSLGECVWIRTLDGKTIVGEAESEQKGGEL